MATMVNNRQQYIAQNTSHRCKLQVTKFHCNSFGGFKTVEESSVGGTLGLIGLRVLHQAFEPF